MFTPAGHRYRATASYNRSENGSALARASSAPRALRWRGIVEGARISVIDPACLDAISSGSGHGGPSQRESAQHVVGEREPQQHGAGLVFAAHEQSGEAHAARPGVGALGLRALLIERFPWLAGHAPAPVRHPRFVGRPKPAIGQFHRPRLGIGGRGARLLLSADLGLVGLLATRPLGLELTHPIERRLHPLLLFARGTLLRRPLAPITRRRIRFELG